MELYNTEDVLRLEQSVLDELGLERDTRYYFDERVARHLYAAWKADRTDNRIIQYSLPIILAMSKKNTKMFTNIGLTWGEIFNILTIGIINALSAYKPSRGRLYSYLTKTLTFRVYDLNQHYKREKERQALHLENWDKPVSDYAAEQLTDFLSFLNKLREFEGPTNQKILDAWVDFVTTQPALASQGMDRIISHICKTTKFPDIVVRPFYLIVLKKYINADLPY